MGIIISVEKVTIVYLLVPVLVDVYVDSVNTQTKESFSSGKNN